MRIKDLYVTQEKLRNVGQLPDMIRFARCSFFSVENLLEVKGHTKQRIVINKFPNGDLFIMDGHHRITSIYLAGRTYLRKEEYELRHWGIDEYVGILLKENWITPFNPYTDVRVDDLAPFKQQVKELMTYARATEICKFIVSNRKAFRARRQFWTVMDLANRYNPEAATYLLGGTFDPFHLGHLAVIKALQHFSLPDDQIIVMPAKVSPHKLGTQPTPFQRRFRYCEKALGSLPKVQVSNWEGSQEGPSYTYNLLSEFAVNYRNFWFVMGTDQFSVLDTWTKAKQWVPKTNILVINRPGCNKLHPKLQPKTLKFIDAPRMRPISSTEIRNRIAKGKPIGHLVPKSYFH